MLPHQQCRTTSPHAVGAESSLAGAEQQWNDAMKAIDDKLQASP